MSLVIIGLLIALLLPAVQHAREAARRMQCRSNLRQIGMALHSYHSLHRMFPPGMSNGTASFHVTILPYVDQQNLYRRIDFSVATTDARNVAVMRTLVPLYVCPSDTAASGAPPAGTNYAGNFGTGVQRFGYNGVFRNIHPMGWQGSPGGPIRERDIRDGLSNTAAVAEILISDGSLDQQRIVWDIAPPLSQSRQFEQFAQTCALRTPTGSPHPWLRGRPWVDGSDGITLYNHVLTPNENSCLNGSVPDGAYSAASLHAGGVHVLLADGSVRFLAQDVDLGAWRALGSRDGREAGPNP